MLISEKDADYFLNEYTALLYYSYSDFEDIDIKYFMESGFNKRIIGRDNIYKNRIIIDDYINEVRFANSLDLTQEKIDLLKEIKIAKFQDFLVIKYNNDVFYMGYDKNIYKITGIKDDPLKVYRHFPCLVKTAILNYRNCIISDGLIEIKKMKFDPKASKLIIRDFEREFIENIKFKIE